MPRPTAEVVQGLPSPPGYLCIGKKHSSVFQQGSAVASQLSVQHQHLLLRATAASSPCPMYQAAGGHSPAPLALRALCRVPDGAVHSPAPRTGSRPPQGRLNPPFSADSRHGCAQLQDGARHYFISPNQTWPCQVLRVTCQGPRWRQLPLMCQNRPQDGHLPTPALCCQELRCLPLRLQCALLPAQRP